MIVAASLQLGPGSGAASEVSSAAGRGLRVSCGALGWSVGSLGSPAPRPAVAGLPRLTSLGSGWIFTWVSRTTRSTNSASLDLCSELSSLWREEAGLETSGTLGEAELEGEFCRGVGDSEALSSA